HVRVVAATGLPLMSLPRDNSLCGQVIELESALVVEDVVRDGRFFDQTVLMPNLRAYAGVPLIGRDGLPLGVLAVTHTERHPFTRSDLRALKVLARGLVAQLELAQQEGRRSPDAQDEGWPTPDARRLRQALHSGELI